MEEVFFIYNNVMAGSSMSHLLLLPYACRVTEVESILSNRPPASPKCLPCFSLLSYYASLKSIPEAIIVIDLGRVSSVSMCVCVYLCMSVCDLDYIMVAGNSVFLTIMT